VTSAKARATDTVVARAVRAQQRALAGSALLLVVLGGALAALDATSREDVAMLQIAHVFVAELDGGSADGLREAAVDELEEQSGFTGLIEVRRGSELLASSSADEPFGGALPGSGTCALEALPRGLHRVCALEANGLVIVVGEPLFVALRPVLFAIGAMALTAFFVTVLGAALSRRAVARALAPLSEFTAKVASSRTGEARAPAAAWDVVEIETLASTVDGLLQRIETAHERERRFLMDASHELRSPLARLRAELELAVSETNDPALVARLTRAGATCERLIRDTESLLALARSEPPAGVAVDIVESVRRVLSDLAVHEGPRAERVTQSGDDEALVRADPALVELVVANLIDNALKFSEGTVRVSVSSRDARVTIEVVDAGAGLATGDEARAFEPFFRGDEARATKSGTGLGLALVLHASRALGGEATLERAKEGGTIARVELPAWSPAR
jgi:signal transduction histidine kinase